MNGLEFSLSKKITKHTDSEQVHEEMLNITNHQENENQNYNEIPLPTWLLLNKGEIASIGEDVEKREPLCTVGGNVNSTATMETGWRFFKKLNIELPYDAVILLLSLCLKKKIDVPTEG